MVVIKLPTNAGSGEQTATINTDIQFPTGVTTSVPNTCDSIITSANVVGSKSAFIDQYKINTGYNCCLCCSSVVGDKWTPTNGIKDVIDEYKKYDSVVRTISIAKLVLNNINMDDLINSTILSFIILLY